MSLFEHDFVLSGPYADIYLLRCAYITKDLKVICDGNDYTFEFDFQDFNDKYVYQLDNDLKLELFYSLYNEAYKLNQSKLYAKSLEYEYIRRLSNDYNTIRKKYKEIKEILNEYFIKVKQARSRYRYLFFISKELNNSFLGCNIAEEDDVLFIVNDNTIKSVNRIIDHYSPISTIKEDVELEINIRELLDDKTKIIYDLGLPILLNKLDSSLIIEKFKDNNEVKKIIEEKRSVIKNSKVYLPYYNINDGVLTYSDMDFHVRYSKKRIRRFIIKDAVAEIGFYNSRECIGFIREANSILMKTTYSDFDTNYLKGIDIDRCASYLDKQKELAQEENRIIIVHGFNLKDNSIQYRTFDRYINNTDIVLVADGTFKLRYAIKCFRATHVIKHYKRLDTFLSTLFFTKCCSLDTQDYLYEHLTDDEINTFNIGLPLVITKDRYADILSSITNVYDDLGGMDKVLMKLL